MSKSPSTASIRSIAAYVEDGARIAAILLVWGVIAAFFAYGVSEIGGTGSLFEMLGPLLGVLFALTGFFNATLYCLYRTVEYWHRRA